MKTGMLWLDDSSRSLKVKVGEAASYYKEKYGEAPTLCFVNPVMLSEKIPASNGVEVKKAKSVLPHHFWIGINEKKKGNGNGRRKAS
jgi:hypothetical protein